MVRKTFSKALRVGRVMALSLGVAVMLALVVGAASAALAGTGVGATFNLGRVNSVNKLSSLVGRARSPILSVTNRGIGTALTLRVRPGRPPMTVSSGKKVKNLNADRLDGQDSSAFLPVNGKAADSNLLDGQDSSSFVQTNTNAFVRNNTYRAESNLGPGTLLGDGTYRIDVTCSPGDVLLSGGPANINSTSTLLESFPASTGDWAVRINKNGQADNFSAVALCAKQ